MQSSVFRSRDEFLRHNDAIIFSQGDRKQVQDARFDSLALALAGEALCVARKGQLELLLGSAWQRVGGVEFQWQSWDWPWASCPQVQVRCTAIAGRVPRRRRSLSLSGPQRLVKTFHSSIVTAMSILGRWSFGTRVIVSAGLAPVLRGAEGRWARSWLVIRAMANASGTSFVLKVQLGTEHSMTTMTKESTVLWSELLDCLLALITTMKQFYKI